MKKPRNKAYRQRAVHLPMMASTRDRLALEFHLAVEAIIGRPGPASYNALNERIAVLIESIGFLRDTNDLSRDKDETVAALRSAVLTMAAIWERWERTGKVVVAFEEQRSLRAAAGQVDVAITRIPKNVYDASAMTVRRNRVQLQSNVEA